MEGLLREKSDKKATTIQHKTPAVCCVLPLLLAVHNKGLRGNQEPTAGAALFLVGGNRGIKFPGTRVLSGTELILPLRSAWKLGVRAFVVLRK